MTVGTAMVRTAFATGMLSNNSLFFELFMVSPPNDPFTITQADSYCNEAGSNKKIPVIKKLPEKVHGDHSLINRTPRHFGPQCELMVQPAVVTWISSTGISSRTRA